MDQLTLTRWAIVDDDGLVANLALWDGVTSWHVASAVMIPLAADLAVGPGWRFEAGSWIEPASTDVDPIET